MAVTAADKLEIQETLARYSHAISEQAADALAALFTEDGVVEIGWSNTSMTTRVEGRQAIHDWCLDLGRYLTAMRYLRQWTGSYVIDPEGEGAHLRCFFITIGRDGSLTSSGEHKARLRRDGSSWRIAYLHSSIDGTREETAAREALLIARLGGG